MAQKTTLKEFESVFPKLEEALLAHAKQYGLPEEYLQWYKQVSLSWGAVVVPFVTCPCSLASSHNN